MLSTKWVKTLAAIFTTTLAAITLHSCTHAPQGGTEKQASFNGFSYEGMDDIFSAPLAVDEYQNPILAGFYPDPSITRAGDDYYLVNSSFAYSPGVPIFHSRDLVHWQSMGHILITPKQLSMPDLRVSQGIYAPTLRYHAGVFYLITTLVGGGGNFIVTATNPAGPWSDPVMLPEIGGIDPDIFFDDDGRVYIAHNDAPIGTPLYEGHRAIWLWEFDPHTNRVIENSGRVIVNGGTDLAQHPIWIEGPHLFKRNGWYYLSCAQGGTSDDHSQVIFRTRSLDESFVAYDHNPILTQRDLPAERANPITSTGHADMVQTAAGEWWAVFLGTRPYDQHFYNTGRETFLLPVHWQDDWPVILPPKTAVPYRHKLPTMPRSATEAAPMTGNFSWRDTFTEAKLLPEWNLLRTSAKNWYALDAAAGQIHLRALPTTLADLAQPAFLGRRQQHMHYRATTELALPVADGISAGIVAFQNEQSHYYLGMKRAADGYALFLEQASQSTPQVIARRSVTAASLGESVVLGVEGNEGKISFYYQTKDGKTISIADNIDGKLLSTAKAGGFVGTYLGVHARQESGRQ